MSKDISKLFYLHLWSEKLIKIEIDLILINFSLRFFAILKNKFAKCISEKSIKIKVVPILINISLLFFANVWEIFKRFAILHVWQCLFFIFRCAAKFRGRENHIRLVKSGMKPYWPTQRLTHYVLHVSVLPQTFTFIILVIRCQRNKLKITFLQRWRFQSSLWFRPRKGSASRWRRRWTRSEKQRTSQKPKS